MTTDSNIRANRIDDAVSAAGELIGLLMTKGSVGPGQARLIVEAVVRAAVPNFERWEIRDSARRIVAEGERGEK
jgi:hypothetical protein